MNLQALLVIHDPKKFDIISKDAQKRIVAAASATCNILAFNTRKEALRGIESTFTLRNTWTRRGIIVDRCDENATRLENIESHIGAKERIGYMARQEFGGKRTAKGWLSIPTEAARGGSNASPVQKSMYLSKIYRNIKNGKGKRKNKGGGDVFIKSEKGIFKIEGRAAKMVYNQKYTETETKPTGWLAAATAKVSPSAPKIFETQADRAFRS